MKNSKRHINLITCFLICLLLPMGWAQADSSEPSHSCDAPDRPNGYGGEFEMQMFLDDAEDYKECLEDFINEQLDEIRNHSEAAENAESDWESFKRRELR